MLVPRHLTKFSTMCIKICDRTLGIHWTWKRREVVSWYNYKPDGRWDSINSRMVNNFEETGHTCVQRNKRIESWDNAEKEENKDTIHYNGESLNVELSYRIVHSVNQLCVHRAVTN